MGIKENEETIRNFYYLLQGDKNARATEILEAFEEGYQNGYWWPDQWQNHGRPGGPFIRACGKRGFFRHDEKTCEMCENAAISSLSNLAWRTGWGIGNKKKIKESKSNTFKDFEREVRDAKD